MKERKKGIAAMFLWYMFVSNRIFPMFMKFTIVYKF